MIDNGKKLIFVHVIKTAGVSIEKQFNQHTHDHRTAMEYQQELGATLFDQYYSFTITRNPWDKMVSQYHYNAFNWVAKNTSFKDYIKAFGSGKQITRFSPFHLPYITNQNGEIMVDYIGRFEALEETMKEVSNAIGIAYQPLPHENKTSRNRDYTRYYDAQSEAIVARLFAKEIELFDYSFGDNA